MKRLGVIGGLGPMATACFMQMVTQMSEAATDQEHIEMLIHSCPQVPDRTAFLLGKSPEDPEPKMAQIGRGLAEAGAEVIAIPCVTANFFYDRLQQDIPVPIINAVQDTAVYLKEHGIGSAGILATDGTVKCGFFQKALEEAGIRAMIPSPGGQRDVMSVIYEDVKAGRPVREEVFERPVEQLRAAGCEVLLLGCTELTMARLEGKTGRGFLDVMELMAMESVKQCGRLKEEYRELIR